MATKSIRDFDAYIDGLNEVLRAFKALPKDATLEMRQASFKVAENHMLPAWRDAAGSVKSWGDDLRDSVRVKKDRIPSVNIGLQKKSYSHGASTNMLRYPTSSGEAGDSPAPFERTDWLGKARKQYGPGALREWLAAVDRIVQKWENN